MSAGAFLIGRDSSGVDRPVQVTDEGLVRVDVGGATLELDAAGIEIKNDAGNPIPVVEGFSIPKYDYISASYTGQNLTGVVYKTGGSDGTTVATLTMTYDGNNNLTSITKS